MSEYSPRLSLPFLQQAQAQKHVTHNEAIELLDLLVQLTLESFDALSPPAAPEEGQVWATGAEPVGAWAGRGQRLAAWVGGGWLFLTPAEGWAAVCNGELRIWNGTSWAAPLAPEMQNLPGVGINTGHDATNRLAVSSAAALFTHEGAGHQLKINKAAPGDTASLLFQTDWSGRAEMGTAGSDDFALKVSADGATWHTGLAFDRNTGNATMKQVDASALTGTAVTQSDSDATPGRVLRTGHRVYPALRSAPGDTGVVSNADTRAVLASTDSRAVGSRQAVIASQNCGVLGSNPNAACIASHDCEVTGRSFILGAFGSRTLEGQFFTGVMASRRVINNVQRSVAMGDADAGDASTANRKIHLFSQNGNIQIAGSLTSGHTFSDFAEMFRNATGVAIPLGTIVTEENGAVRPAGDGDEIAGVVTATAVVTAGDTPFAWQGRYLSDEWGQPILQTIPDPDHDGDGPAPMITVQVQNPAWDPSLPQTPRSERPADWTRVGLLGQVFTRVAADVVPGDRLSALGGIGVKSTARTGLRCMTIAQPFDAAKGYAVAMCLVNVQV